MNVTSDSSSKSDVLSILIEPLLLLFMVTLLLLNSLKVYGSSRRPFPASILTFGFNIMTGRTNFLIDPFTQVLLIVL